MRERREDGKEREGGRVSGDEQEGTDGRTKVCMHHWLKKESDERTGGGSNDDITTEGKERREELRLNEGE